jgi:hypothetical protein
MIFSLRWPWMPAASTTPLGSLCPVEGVRSVSVTVYGGLTWEAVVPAAAKVAALHEVMPCARAARARQTQCQTQKHTVLLNAPFETAPDHFCHEKYHKSGKAPKCRIYHGERKNICFMSSESPYEPHNLRRPSSFVARQNCVPCNCTHRLGTNEVQCADGSA